MLHIPKIGWGIIDSCVQKVGKNFLVPPLEYLSKIIPPPFPKLAFVILTHPHEDHYKGLDQILMKYPGGTERVCRYDGDGIRELKVYIAQQKTALRQVLPDLAGVFKAMDEADKSGVQFRRLSEMTAVFDKKNVIVHEYGPTDIRMMALSPSAASIQKYVEILFNAIPEVGKPVLPMDDEAHNLLSVALLLKVGDIQVILGSDVETGSQDKTGWMGIILNRDCPDLWANLVKVPHHGSKNGHNALAWEKFCGKTKPFTVIAPFFKGSVILPEEKDIKRTKKMSNKVGLTCSTRLGTNLNKFYSRSVVRNIMNKTRSIKIIEPPKKIGLIRVRYLLDGTVTQCIAKAPARWC